MDTLQKYLGRGKVTDSRVSRQERAILNIQACLEACGLTLDNILTRRVYVIPMEEYRDVMAVWDGCVLWPLKTTTRLNDLLADTSKNHIPSLHSLV